ncbi:MAG: hypothetical protein ACYC92_11740 [Candidatus Acidiferrales bacterium]
MWNTQILRIARSLGLFVAAAASLGAIRGSTAFAQQTHGATNARLARSLVTPSSMASSAPSFAPSVASLKKEAQESRPVSDYVRLSFDQRLHFYAWRTYGPVTMSELIMGAALSQADDVPPEWRQGWGAYGKRIASHVGASAIGGTTEFALAEAFRLDTRYYPCTCKKIWPRVRHALLSTITARAGEDGHRVFSVPSVAAPYASAFSTLAWYPSRYGPKDSFRTGNYNLLDTFGQNVALEFLSPLLHKIHIH